MFLSEYAAIPRPIVSEEMKMRLLWCLWQTAHTYRTGITCTMRSVKELILFFSVVGIPLRHYSRRDTIENINSAVPGLRSEYTKTLRTVYTANERGLVLLMGLWYRIMVLWYCVAGGASASTRYCIWHGSASDGRVATLYSCGVLVVFDVWVALYCIVFRLVPA